MSDFRALAPTHKLVLGLRGVPRALLEGLLRFQLRRVQIENIAGHHLSLSPLSSKSIVIDLGANVGRFSSEVVRRLGCRCIAVEPAPEMFQQIEIGPFVEKFPVAIAMSTGRADLYLSNNPEANSFMPGVAGLAGIRRVVPVPTVSLEHFMLTRGIVEVDLLKVDIEGAERDLFESLSDDTLRRISQLTVEFHDFLPGARDATLFVSVRRRLARLGFLSVILSRPRGDHSDVLFIQRRLIGTSIRIHLALLSGIVLPLLGLLTAVSARWARRTAQA